METDPLIVDKSFVLYCEHDNKRKLVRVTDDGVEFSFKGEYISLPYIQIKEIKYYKIWWCGCGDLIRIGDTSGMYYHFSGRNAKHLEQAIQNAQPECETFL